MKYAKKRNPALEVTLTLVLAATGLGLVSCSSEPTRVDSDTAAADVRRDTSDALGVQDKTTFVTEVSFDRGSANLKTDSKQKLDQLVNKAKQNGEVDDVKIISWADVAYPANAKTDLPNSQKKLAEKRIDTIKDYIRHDNSFDVDTFNMAKKPSAISDLFHTENSRVKRSLSNAGVSDTGVAPSKTGKAMVLVIMKDTRDSRNF